MTPELEQEIRAEFDTWHNQNCVGSTGLAERIFTAAFLAGRASTLGKLEQVVEVVDTYGLVWVGNGPIAPIIRKHNIKIGDKLYRIQPEIEKEMKK